MPRAFRHDTWTKKHQRFFLLGGGASLEPTFVFQLFSLRTFCLRHDSKLRSLSVMTLLHIFSWLFSLESEYYYANIKYKLLVSAVFTLEPQEILNVTSLISHAVSKLVCVTDSQESCVDILAVQCCLTRKEIVSAVLYLCVCTAGNMSLSYKSVNGSLNCFVVL